MRSVDLTAAAQIRDAAMHLFAERGAGVVTVRDVAAAAGVSPSLVMHHYGSKDGLKGAIDDHVAARFSEVLTEFLGLPEHARLSTSTTSMLAERLGDGPMLAYLCRLLIDGGPAATRLFRSLYDMSHEFVGRFVEAGVFRPSADDDARAAVLLVNDLGVMLLRDRVADVLGVDPLHGDGFSRWSVAVMDLYTNGLMVEKEDRP